MLHRRLLVSTVSSSLPLLWHRPPHNKNFFCATLGGLLNLFFFFAIRSLSSVWCLWHLSVRLCEMEPFPLPLSHAGRSYPWFFCPHLPNALFKDADPVSHLIAPLYPLMSFFPYTEYMRLIESHIFPSPRVDICPVVSLSVSRCPPPYSFLILQCFHRTPLCHMVVPRRFRPFPFLALLSCGSVTLPFVPVQVNAPASLILRRM